MPAPLAGLSSGLHRQPFRLIINAEREGAHVSNPGGVVGVVIAPELPVAVRLCRGRTNVVDLVPLWD